MWIQRFLKDVMHLSSYAINKKTRKIPKPFKFNLAKDVDENFFVVSTIYACVYLGSIYSLIYIWVNNIDVFNTFKLPYRFYDILRELLINLP